MQLKFLPFNLEKKYYSLATSPNHSYEWFRRPGVTIIVQRQSLYKCETLCTYSTEAVKGSLSLALFSLWHNCVQKVNCKVLCGIYFLHHPGVGDHCKYISAIAQQKRQRHTISMVTIMNRLQNVL